MGKRQKTASKSRKVVLHKTNRYMNSKNNNTITTNLREVAKEIGIDRIETFSDPRRKHTAVGVKIYKPKLTKEQAEQISTKMKQRGFEELYVSKTVNLVGRKDIDRYWQVFGGWRFCYLKK